jgi:hypothetical protein
MLINFAGFKGGFATTYPANATWPLCCWHFVLLSRRWMLFGTPIDGASLKKSSAAAALFSLCSDHIILPCGNRSAMMRQRIVSYTRNVRSKQRKKRLAYVGAYASSFILLRFRDRVVGLLSL